MKLPEKKWAGDPKYRALLLFAQLVENMVWYGTRDSYRAPSLNTYHRCVEILRAADEIKLAHLRDGILSSMFDEFSDFAKTDPTVKQHFSAEWDKVDFAFKNGTQRNKVFAVQQFKESLEGRYFKRCRREIEKMIANEKANDKDRLERLAGDFCSYILNVGHSAEQISYIVNVSFFEREATLPPVREVQKFFSEFPCRESLFQVFMFTTKELADTAKEEGCELLTKKLPRPMSLRHGKFLEDTTKFETIQYRDVRAFDPADARIRSEAKLSFARAITYTNRPRDPLSWRPEVIVSWEKNESGILLNESPAPLRRRYRTSESYSEQILDQRRKAISGNSFSERDKNKIGNAIIGYSNAFHSESPSTQLVAVWSSLEGLLPEVTDNASRIDSVVSAALACQRAKYFQKIFQWAFIDHYALGKEDFFKIVDKVTLYKTRLSRFIAALCFEEFEEISNELGKFAFRSPLTSHRGFRLKAASKKVAELSKIIDGHQKKVDWQLRRIYRERNRIVHQANPSANVTTLILNLNEYFLVCLDAFFDVSGRAMGAQSVDGLFTQIYLEEEYRRSRVSKLGSKPLAHDNASLIFGFELS